MFENIKVAYHLLREAFSGGNLKALFKQQVFWKRLATPTEIDLTGVIPSPAKLLHGTDCQFAELNMDDLRAGKWTFVSPSRRLKALRNIKRGLRCFALIKDSSVVGDMWCAVPNGKGSPATHRDLDMLGIVCKEKEAYTVDMFIDPTVQGKNMAVPLLHFIHATLKAEGFRKIYGYYWNDNLPTLWMHRMLKFRELPKKRVYRFFSYIRTEEVGQASVSAPKTGEGHSSRKSRTKK